MEQRIEDYFEKQLSASEKQQFENEMKTNTELAESVAFYLLVKQTARENTREKVLAERHADWQKLPEKHRSKTITLQLLSYAAAAMLLLALGLGWYFLASDIKGREELADRYVQENFSTLSVHMDGRGDSLQQVIGAYNKGDFKSANEMAEAILQRDPQNAEVQKTAGIISLRLKNYDKAISYFRQLAAQQNLYSNPGKFYEAIAHLQRGLPLDKKTADDLLKEVIDSNLEGKEEAEKWVK